jgi:hypothetical protein
MYPSHLPCCRLAIFKVIKWKVSKWFRQPFPFPPFQLIPGCNISSYITLSIRLKWPIIKSLTETESITAKFAYTRNILNAPGQKEFFRRYQTVCFKDYPGTSPSNRV